MQFKFKKTNKNSEEYSHINDFISYLMVCRNVLHAMHLRTNSYAEHKAINEFYESLGEHIDNIAEVSQGYYGKLLSLKFETGNEYLSMNPIDYSIEILKNIEQYKLNFIDNSMITNEIDNLIKDLSSLLYKLRFLK